ncbi:MAG: class I SAM-dependent methyltransferase, partial [Wenzhouxiangella sp.]
VDISEDMLHQARTDYPWAKVEQGDIRTLDLPEKGFDVTVCSQFLKYATVEELPKLIEKLARATRHRMLISIFTGNSLVRRNRNYIHPLPLLDRSVRLAGFQLRARGDIEPPHHHLWICEAA